MDDKDQKGREGIWDSKVFLVQTNQRLAKQPDLDIQTGSAIRLKASGIMSRDFGKQLVSYKAGQS